MSEKEAIENLLMEYIPDSNPEKFEVIAAASDLVVSMQYNLQSANCLAVELSNFIRMQQSQINQMRMEIHHLRAVQNQDVN